MVFSPEILFFFIAALLACSIGFRNYVWFISIGYGLAIAVQGGSAFYLFRDELSPATAALAVILIVYGLRLGGYLTYRERKVASYAKNMKGEIKDGKTVSYGVKLAIWFTCGLLYVLQVSPVFFRLYNGCGSDIWAYLGALISVSGIIMESVADIQKNKAKKLNPRRFVDTGLYRFVRCPNYLGEVIMWTGILISGIGAVSGIGQWIVVLLGYAGIIYVMFSGTRRLEVRQDKNYGSDPRYQEYIKTVPILLPFVPLYSVKKHKWLVA